MCSGEAPDLLRSGRLDRELQRSCTQVTTGVAQRTNKVCPHNSDHWDWSSRYNNQNTSHGSTPSTTPSSFQSKNAVATSSFVMNSTS